MSLHDREVPLRGAEAGEHVDLPAPEAFAEKIQAELAGTSGMYGGPMQSRRYIAKHGDTLEKVSRQFYGEPDGWRRILDANRDRVTDVDALRAGTELIVP